MKFNIDNYKGKYAMHCKTYDEAVNFCNYLHSTGRCWINGRKYCEYTNWERYKTKTIYYFNKGSYCEIDLVNQGYTVLEWSDFMSDTMSNKDRINKVFGILGVKPNEYFKMIDAEFNEESNGSYCIDDNLKLHCSALRDEYVERNSSNAIIIDILRGKKVITPTPTEKEQLAIDYARALGCKWIAKDKEDLLYAFTEKPHKMTTVWNVENGEHYVINIPISFVYWDDEEPYYIGD